MNSTQKVLNSILKRKNHGYNKSNILFNKLNRMNKKSKQKKTLKRNNQLKRYISAYLRNNRVYYKKLNNQKKDLKKYGHLNKFKIDLNFMKLH